MYSKLGNEIWKEMKAQGITQAALLKALGMPGLRLTETLIDEQIDLHVLIMISKVLRKNFFQYLEADELDKVLQNNKVNVLKGKISDLMDSNTEKAALLQNRNREIGKLLNTIDRLRSGSNKK
jgi:transcriptional regulator with XRE-family HTH domain